MKKGAGGYIIEESGDELNDETFGDLNDDLVGKADFDFAGQAKVMPGAPKPSAVPSSSPGARRGLTAADLEQQLIQNRSPQQPGPPAPPGMRIPGRKVVMNLDELENSFRSSVSFGSGPQTFPEAVGSAPLAGPRPTSPPPGLKPYAPKPAPTITFPMQNPSDINRHLMTRYEREGIRHIHMAQLTTENPVMEDFYYQAYSKRSLKNRDQANTPLYLPLPVPRGDRKKKEQQAKDPKEARPSPLEGALGKVSSSSSRKPRQQLQVDFNDLPQSMKLDSEDVSSEGLYLAVLGAAERIFHRVCILEDALHQHDTEESDFDASAIDTTKQETKAAIIEISDLDPKRKWGRGEVLRFINLLALSKGRKALFRALRILDGAFAKLFLTRLMENLEYLSVFRPNATVAEIDSFVNLILSPLVPFVSEASAPFITDTVKAFVGKPSFLWLLYSRPGVILLCILLSRVEICKSALATDLDTNPLLGQAWPAFVKSQFYDQIAERLLDFFNIPSFKALLPRTTAGGVTFDGGNYYVWQLLALIALNVDAEAKRSMIVELRDRIMSVVQHGSPKDITNLNIFLNVLGLDSSQL